MNPFNPITFPAKMNPEFASVEEAKTWAEDVHRFGYEPAEHVVINGRRATVRISEGRVQMEYSPSS